MTWILGVDPGCKGVFSIMDVPGRRLWLHDIPYVSVKRGRAKPRNELVEAEVAQLFRQLLVDSNGDLLAGIEAQSAAGMIGHMGATADGSARPMGGSPSSMYQQLGGYFMLRGLLTGIGIAYADLPAAAWKKEMKLSSNKDESRDLAIRTMPLCVNSFAAGRARADYAEAACIGLYMAKVNNILIPSNMQLVPKERMKKAA